MDFSWSIGVDKDVKNGIGSRDENLQIRFQSNLRTLLKQIVCAADPTWMKILNLRNASDCRLEIEGNEVLLKNQSDLFLATTQHPNENLHKNQIPKRAVNEAK